LLIFDGELTDERADRLKEALMLSLDNAEHVVVSFEKVTKIDLNCIQLFYAAYKKSRKLKKRLTLIGVNPNTHKRLEETVNYQMPINWFDDSNKSSMLLTEAVG
jgi:anti-anti-sigma regulatory factor